MKLMKSRREWTTRGADPTVIVDWTVKAETAPQLAAFVTEFQGIYRGEWRSPSGNYVMQVMTEIEAQLIHEGLEAEHELNERIKAENEQDDRQVDEPEERR